MDGSEKCSYTYNLNHHWLQHVSQDDSQFSHENISQSYFTWLIYLAFTFLKAHYSHLNKGKSEIYINQIKQMSNI